ncbi:MAG: hypothetical protein FWE35_26885 [Streptosporangiales bacterium]|jgi:hypothetical protein|nr:hypothetical protein [Streptosporangiales bacterium]
MPSPWHDSVTKIVDDDPDFAITLLRDVLGLEDVPRAHGHLGPNVFNTRPSQDLIADQVVIVGRDQDPDHVIIVEAQKEPLEHKLIKFAKYSAAAWLQYNCPADVLVICPDVKTAAWYTQPVVTGMGASRFRPRVLFPELVPTITNPNDVAADPRMAVLSVAYHGEDEKVSEAFLDGIQTLGKDKTRQYHEYAFAMSSQDVRELLRRIMTTTHWPLYSDMAKENYGQGQRDALLTLVDKRGLALSDKQRGLIEDTDDLDQLKGWFDAAITAESADDIFK